MMFHGRRRGVSPVMGNLLMIAVAVAMSVVIFVWSQGFLSQTSSAAGGQQSQQNMAASSGVAIDSVVFGPQKSGSGTITVTVVVRDVGSVSVTLGSLLVQGVPTNAGLRTSILCGTFSSTAEQCSQPSSPTVSLKSSAGTSGSSGVTAIAKSSAATLTLTWAAGTSGANLLSGDTLTIKVSTTAGTFAAQQYVVS